MTTKTVYTDRLDPDSSVIRTIYYNRHNQELFVLLRRGDVLCGYADVPAPVWTSLVLIDENEESVGSYWNAWIKDHFEGISTDGLTLVAEGESQPKPYPSFSPDTLRYTQEEQPTVEFSTFMINLDDDDSHLPIVATSVTDAVERFNKIAEIAGWDNLRITSVTQFFDES